MTSRVFVENMDLFDVSEKVVLVTGGARGIGRMIATGFVMRGATVVISSRSAEACDSCATELSTIGPGKCISIPEDISTDAGCGRLAAAVAERFPALHVCVHNSGTSWGGTLETYPEGAWNKVMALNVVAIFQLTRALLPLLDAASCPGDPARVITIGSIAGIQHQPFPTYAYDVSKAAVHSLTKKLACDLAQRGHGKNITVNAIAPGYVPTKMSAQLDSYVGSADGLSKAIPLGRLGTDSDMAGAAIFLSSRASAWITGVILPVDGGASGASAMMVAPSKL